MKDSFKIMTITLIMGFVLLMGATSYSNNQYKNNKDYKEFMKYCAVSDDTKGFCDCSYKELTDNYSYTEIRDMLGSGVDDISPEIYKVAAYCMKEIK